MKRHIEYAALKSAGATDAALLYYSSTSPLAIADHGDGTYSIEEGYEVTFAHRSLPEILAWLDEAGREAEAFDREEARRVYVVELMRSGAFAACPTEQEAAALLSASAEPVPEGLDAAALRSIWSREQQLADRLAKRRQAEEKRARKSSEARARAVAKYDAANTRQLHLKLNTGTDAALLDYLDRTGNIQGTIKAALAAWMESHPL